jgi:hypothetical protein
MTADRYLVLRIAIAVIVSFALFYLLQFFAGSS